MEQEILQPAPETAQDDTAADRNAALDRKLRQYFDGRIVRKDLTKSIKEGANVPVYVLEFLLGQYCSSDDEEIIQKGVQNVKRILAEISCAPTRRRKSSRCCASAAAIPSSTA